MTNFLIKHFVKNYKQTNDSKVRSDYIALATTVGIIVNLILFVIKLIISLSLNSISVLADGINNLMDSGVYIVTLIGFKMSKKPADKEHPFGHGRIEYISAFIVSFFIILLGWEFLKTSFIKILHPEQMEFNIIMVCILVATSGVNIWITIFNHTIGSAINSNALKASSLEAKNDCITTIFTIISIIITKVSGVYVDGYISVLVALFILKSGFDLSRSTLAPLLGEPIDSTFANELKVRFNSYPEILGIHDLIVHNYGPTKVMATVHVEVSKKLSLEEAHRVIDTIENQMKTDFNLAFLIHTDVVDLDNKKLGLLKKEIITISKSYDEYIDAHDFRMIEKNNHSLLIFELLVPHAYKSSKIELIEKEIRNKVNELDNLCTCIIDLEYGYISNTEKV